MILKPNRIVFILIVCFLFLVLFCSMFIYDSFQKSNIKYWEVFIKNFAYEKNNLLLLTFFKGSGREINIDKLNFKHLEYMISEDKSLYELHLTGLMILSVNNNIIYDQDLNRDNNFSSVSIDLIQEKIEQNLQLNEITIKHIQNNGSKFSLVICPLFNSYFEHKQSIVYIFNNDYLYEKSLPFKTTFYFGVILLLTFMISVKIIQLVYSRYIKNICNFIEKDVLIKNTVNPYKLKYFKPFDKLEKNITYLSAQKRELENKYLQISERFHYLISLTGEGLIMEDEEGFIYFCNNRFAKILDYEDESEIIGKKFIDLLYDKNSLDNYENETKFRNYKPQTTYSVNLITKKGFKKECLLTGSLIKDVNDNIIGYYGAITDISSLNSFNQDELDLANLKSEIVNQQQNPIVILDIHENIYEVNEAFINYIKQNKSDIIGHEFIKTVKNFEIETMWSNKNNVLNGSFELFEPSLNKWYYVLIKKVEYKNQDYLILIFLNITNIRRYEIYHKFILEDIKGFFFITNLKNKVIYLSPSFPKITGNPEGWFDNYFNSLINLSENKKLNTSEPMVVSHFKNRYEFNVNQLQTGSSSMKLYLAILK